MMMMMRDFIMLHDDALHSEKDKCERKIKCKYIFDIYLILYCFA